MLYEAVMRGTGGCAVSSTRLRSGIVFVAVSGECDSHTAPMLGRVLTAAFAGGAANIAVDLSDCSFVDSAAILTLLQAQAALNKRGGRLSLISPGREVRRALEVSTLDSPFHVHESRIQALGIVIDG